MVFEHMCNYIVKPNVIEILKSKKFVMTTKKEKIKIGYFFAKNKHLLVENLAAVDVELFSMVNNKIVYNSQATNQINDIHNNEVNNIENAVGTTDLSVLKEELPKVEMIKNNFKPFLSSDHQSNFLGYVEIFYSSQSLQNLIIDFHKENPIFQLQNILEEYFDIYENITENYFRFSPEERYLVYKILGGFGWIEFFYLYLPIEKLLEINSVMTLAEFKKAINQLFKHISEYEIQKIMKMNKKVKFFYEKSLMVSSHKNALAFLKYIALIPTNF
ncbi:uncharacterized protein ASCRUDRAFT_9647 [Ascoidea rubescens DSM 1968]|uniref:Uncharacterized protein n=1 Tax=Ascoidea rubescens DSM 1968 TaxID=1344418 RepID=A0A1D2VCN5_9ASCO|nr:hypothetical protein ASCRUDRAFT_9647 [Ascoidea rubescens DSM 1968]ODV59253.1 hypothetical protein ASCRUDRAFT_9647 [Ascoidea rubescens DSM 1968]